MEPQMSVPIVGIVIWEVTDDVKIPVYANYPPVSSHTTQL